MPTPTPQYTWSEAAGRYVSTATGRYVTFDSVRQATEAVTRRSQANIKALAESLRAGEVNLADWQSGMTRELKMLHLSSAAAARGGWAQMTQADFGQVGAQLKTQYNFLNRMAGQIADGTQALDGRLVVRVNLYAQSGRGTFEDMRRRIEEAGGAELERRVLGIADHCKDCLREAAKNWQPIGVLARIGDSICRTNCHCHFEFQQPDISTQSVQAPGI
jgi:hypothetical protein